MRSWNKQVALSLIPGATFMALFVLISSGFPSNILFTLFDDSMISMSYGQTLAETGELVWFPDAERVQGFTNPLWTFWMALIHWIGLQGSSAALVVSLSGILILLAVSYLTSNLLRSLLGDGKQGHFIAMGAGASVPFLYPLTFWTLRGMEVGLLSLLTLIIVRNVLNLTGEKAPDNRSRDRSRWQILLILGSVFIGVLTRVDFLVVPIAVSLWVLISRVSKPKATWIIVTISTAAFTALIMVLGSQYLYFGEILPNTYSLKMEGFTVQDRVVRGVLSNLKFIPILILMFWSWRAVIGSATSSSQTSKAILLFSTVVAGIAAYSIWVGGDAWEWSMLQNRYLSTALPLTLITIAVGLDFTLTHLQRHGLIEKKQSYLLFTAPLSGIVAGITTNPIDFDPLRGLYLSTITGIVVLIWLRRAKSLQARVWAPADVLLILILPILFLGLLPATRALLVDRDIGPLIKLDERVTRYSMELQTITLPNAMIATVWAGAPGYYSHRPMIDLLGKSDRFIAKGAPHIRDGGPEFGPLFPGHNKWNYEYSIGSLRPDVIFQLWNPDTRDLQNIERWGYQKRCMPSGQQIWVLTESAEVLQEKLHNC